MKGGAAGGGPMGRDLAAESIAARQTKMSYRTAVGKGRRNCRSSLN